KSWMKRRGPPRISLRLFEASSVIVRAGGRSSHREVRRSFCSPAMTGCSAFAGHDSVGQAHLMRRQMAARQVAAQVVVEGDRGVPARIDQDSRVRGRELGHGGGDELIRL